MQTLKSTPLPETRPDWVGLVQAAEPWFWRSGMLVHRRAVPSISAAPAEPPPAESAAVAFVRRVLLNHLYATHNSSPSVERAIASLLAGLPAGEWGLNVGAGGKRLHPRVLNLDVYDPPETDILTSGQDLPFLDRSLALILSQEVLEHLPDPAHTVREAARVLKPGGRFYCQVPFMIGYHPGPTDFWRFTRQGLQQLFAGPEWEIEELAIVLGHGSGFYRIAVEYVAVNFSLLSPKLYLPAKGAAALALFPLKWPDLLSHRSAQQDRIPGGYFCVARRL